MTDLEKIRRQAGWSRDKAAVEAKVAYATAKIYELNPGAVVDPERRARLDGVWDRMRVVAASRALFGGKAA